MKKFKLSLLIFLILSVFVGCEEKKAGDIKYDFNNQTPFENAILKMPPNEQVLFIKNFELVAYVSGGEHKIQGMTINQIKIASNKIKEMARKDNIKFLTAKIKEMKSKNKDKAYIHKEQIFLSNPRRGMIYNKSYTIQELENTLKVLIDRGEIK